jgi:hypothetical protein
VILHYNDEEVERIVLPEAGKLTEAPRPGSPWRDDSWIEGDSIVIHMSDDEVDSVRIFGNARAMYYPYEGTENKVSNNFARGDTMYFRFIDEELTYVNISGSASGSYNYINLGGDETIDSVAAMLDSSLTVRDFDLESETVAYEASRIEYFATTEDIVLHENAKVKYQNKSLDADFINFSSRLNVLDAQGDPVLEEAEQKMYGNGMGYDMDSEGGLVKDGATKYDTGYYLGKRIFKQGDDVLKVYGSIYTTCDYRRNHYSMRADKMKVYIDDKIVSGPIKLYIGEIPCFYLPFMVNSIRRDRHSGFLRPNFDVGINSRDGRFIRGIGYYWATNDYTDFVLSTDFNEYRNFRIHLKNRYKVRYMLNGNFDADFFRDFESNTYEWTFKAKHSQNFGRTASLRSNLSFVSSDAAPSSVHRADDVDRIVDRRIYSTASFSKSWGGTRLGLSASRNQKLNVSSTNPNENSLTTTMPSFSFNLPRMSLWFGEKHSGSEKSTLESILREVTFSPNLKATRTTEVSEARRRERLTAGSSVRFGKQNKLLFLNLTPSIGMSWSYAKVLNDFINPLYITPEQSAVMVGDTVTTPTVSAPVSILAANSRLRVRLNGVESDDLLVSEGDYVTGQALADAIQYTINAYFGSGEDGITVEYIENGNGTGSFMFSTVRTGPDTSIEFVTVADAIYTTIGITPGFVEVGRSRQGLTEDTSYKNEVSMSMSMGVGTTLYGLFYPGIGPLKGIRHTFNPSISYSYTPALTANQTSRQSMSWSLRNVIDLKYLKGGRETSKNGAFTWNMNGTIDPQGIRERIFSDISSNIRTSLAGLATISLNNRIDPYDWEVLSTRFSASANFGGTFSYPAEWKLPEREKIAAAKDLEEEVDEEPEPEEEDEDEFMQDEFDEWGEEVRDEESSRRDRGRPGTGNRWSLSLGYSYSGFGGSSFSPPSSKIDMRGNLQLSQGWKLNWSAYFDIGRREFTSQQYSITRDLHCWEAGFVHRRFGDDFSFYFQIRIKAHGDIMYERGKRGARSQIPGFL